MAVAGQTVILDHFLNGLRIRVCVSCLPTSPCLMLLYTPSFAFSAPELAPQDLADSCTRSFYLLTPTLVDMLALSSERAATRMQCRQQTVVALRPSLLYTRWQLRSSKGSPA